jgi:hypothetical protein
MLCYDLINRSGKSSFLKAFTQYLSDYCSEEVSVLESFSYDEIGNKAGLHRGVILSTYYYLD